MVQRVPQSGISGNSSFRNLLINGDMKIAQRATSVAISGNSDEYGNIDRWKCRLYNLGAFTVSSSDTITLTTPRATGVHIGFNFIPILETMPIDKELAEGPLTGLPRRISRAIIDLNSTLDLTIKAADKTAKSLVVQQVNFTGGSDLNPVTAKKEFFFLGYDKSPTVTLSQDDPLPMKVLGMSVEVVFA